MTSFLLQSNQNDIITLLLLQNKHSQIWLTCCWAEQSRIYKSPGYKVLMYSSKQNSIGCGGRGRHCLPCLKGVITVVLTLAIGWFQPPGIFRFLQTIHQNHSYDGIVMHLHCEGNCYVFMSTRYFKPQGSNPVILSLLLHTHTNKQHFPLTTHSNTFAHYFPYHDKNSLYCASPERGTKHVYANPRSNHTLHTCLPIIP